MQTTPAGYHSVTPYLIVGNAAKALAQAVKASGKALKPVENQFWGDRTGTLIDPFGHKWTLGAHIEDVPPEEPQQRMEAWTAQQRTTH